MSRRRFRLIVTLLLFVSCIAAAQSAPAGRPNPADEKALALLESIVERLPTLRSPGNRIQVAFAVADLLWVRDEKRAREVFEMVTKDMAAALASVDETDQEAHNSLSLLQYQRQQILDRFAPRDPELALSFLRATRLEASSESRVFANPENERNLELHLAAVIVEKDPGMALRLARASLPKGLNYNLVALIPQIHQKDPAASRALYREAVARLGEDDPIQNQEAYNAGWNLLASFTPPQANEQTYRQLIEILASKTLAVTTGDSARNQFAQNLYNQLRWILPQIETYAPARVSALRQWSQMVERTFDVNTRLYNEFNELSQSGTAEDILALVNKYPAEHQNQIHQQAIRMIMNSGDSERARQLTAELISDPGQRRQIIAEIDNQLLWKAAGENKVAETRRLLSNVKNVEQRVNILIQLATSLAGKGDKKGAVALLDEARVFLASLPQSFTKLLAHLQLSRNYCSLDSDLGVTLLQPLISQINRLVAAAVVLDGVEQRYLKDGEWMPHSSTNLSTLVSSLDQALGQVATQDFDNASRLSDQVERPEIRLMTQLTIAQAVLGKGINNLSTVGRRHFTSCH